MATPQTPRPTACNPTLLAPGESVYLLSGDHPFQDIDDKFTYTVQAIGKGRFSLIALIEHHDSSLEPVGSRAQVNSVYFHRRSFGGTVAHAASYDWPCSGEHEERIYITLHPGIKHVALVLYVHTDDGASDPITFTTHVMSGRHANTSTPTRQHCRVETTGPSDNSRGSRHVVAVIHNHHSAVRLEASALPSADPTTVLSLDEAKASFCETEANAAQDGSSAS
jgi:hypothetical protein